MKRVSPFLALILLFISCSCNTTVKTKNDTKPQNVILLIGDGMGLSQVSSTFFCMDGDSNFDRFKHIGLINTSCATHKVTDSGAAATAFAIGKKSFKGAIGVALDSTICENIVEICSKKNISTGIVATSSITNATPACFYSHVDNRKKDESIAAQLTVSEVDFFAGGGLDHFTKRSDKINYFDSLLVGGFVMDTLNLSFKAPISAEEKYGFLMAQKNMPWMLEGRGAFLPKSTQMALDHLSLNENGFFLMVEGSLIDKAAHRNKSDLVLAEMNDFNNTIAVAMDFAEKNENTLVIVLADHETGGFTLSDKKKEDAPKEYSVDKYYNAIEPTFATDGHSASLIPVFAYGPGAETFMGIYQNNDIFHKIMGVTHW